MKFPLRAALSAAALLFAMNAQATVYSFSYTFADNAEVHGTLNGDAAGDYVTNISDVHVFFNGTEFTGTLFQSSFDDATQQFVNLGQATLSANAALNNFAFAEIDPTGAITPDNYFYFINGDIVGQEVFAVNFNTGDVALDSPAQSNWTLTAAAADVPEPASIALTLGGLGLLGFSRRRRA